MKTIPIVLTLLATICCAESTDDIARRAIRNSAFIDNGLDRSPEGRRRTILINSDFTLAVHMESGEVSERVRLAYALKCLKEQLRGSIVKANGSVFEEDKIETAKMRERIAAQIALLENRYVEIHLASQLEQPAEQAGAGQPATRPESKSEGNEKPQSKTEGRSR
jgi:hypothetical protein